MVNKTQRLVNKLTKENYLKHTDKYFLRSKDILRDEAINPIVRYQVFVREDIKEIKGVDETIEFIRDVVGKRVLISSLRDGQKYRAKEPIMKLEGYIQDLIDLETGYLEILSGNLTEEVDLDKIRQSAREIINVAQGKPVYYFGARHFHYSLDEQIAKICQEEGFQGCSTDIGAKAWNSKGIGTIPHALILAYTAHIHEYNLKDNPTVAAARGFDAVISCDVPRTILVDTFNREIDDSIEVAKHVPNLAGVRVDTCGENYSQNLREIILPKINVENRYLFGKGVCIAGVWALRRSLDANNLANLTITVSSGFNAEKTKAFVEADKIYHQMYKRSLFDFIGTGSLEKPVMATSDIVAYLNEKKIWVPLSKKGRPEIKSERLEART